MADDFDYRFSSEVFDGETGLVYYNFRYYSPELGRWLSRDPIGENGGENLFAMVLNNAVNKWDLLGEGIVDWSPMIGSAVLDPTNNNPAWSTFESNVLLDFTLSHQSLQWTDKCGDSYRYNMTIRYLSEVRSQQRHRRYLVTYRKGFLLTGQESEVRVEYRRETRVQFQFTTITTITFDVKLCGGSWVNVFKKVHKKSDGWSD